MPKFKVAQPLPFTVSYKVMRVVNLTAQVTAGTIDEAKRMVKEQAEADWGITPGEKGQRWIQILQAHKTGKSCL
jgi:hypothetical protein